MDFYLLSPGNTPINTKASLERWSITPEDRHLTVTIHRSSEEGSLTESAIYDPNGRLLRTYQRWNHNNTHINETVGVTDGDKITVTHRMQIDEDQNGINDIPEVKNVGNIPYTPAIDTIPNAWLPLALGYHIREDHLDAVIRLRERGAAADTHVYRVQNVGTETLLIGNKEYETHLMIAKINIEIDEKIPRFGAMPLPKKMSFHCLSSGEIVKVHVADENGNMQLLCFNATEQQSREQFGNDAIEGDVDFELFTPWKE